MRVIAGQAARSAGLRLHWLLQLGLALLVLLLAGVAGLVWRLDQGPLDLPWLARRIERAAAARGVPLHVGRAELAWGGFSGGAGAALQVTLHDLSADPAPLRAALLQAGFDIGALLRGDLMPASVVLDGLRAEVQRRPDGSLALGTRPDSRQITPAAGNGGGHGGGPDWRLPRHLHVHDVQVSGFDAPLGLSWTLNHTDIDLDRSGSGLAGAGSAQVAAGGLSVTATLAARPADDGTLVDLRLTQADPAALAALSPAFAPLSALDAPVTLAGSVHLGADLLPRAGTAQVLLGAGTLHAGTGTAPILAGSVQASATAQGGDATLALETAARPDAPRTHISGTLHAARAASGWTAAGHFGLDQVAFADLPALWPEGTGGKGTRPWITQNIPSGTASDGRVDLTLAAPADLSTVKLASLNAVLDGHDLTVWWLRPVPPIVHGEVRLTVTDPNAIDIAVSSARQSTGAHDGPAYSNGHVHVVGINDPDQVAEIDTDLSGQVADLLTVLKNKRVRLLDKRPVPMRDPGGTFAAHLAVHHLLLRDDVKMDDLAISTTAHFDNLHLGGVAGGRDLDHGRLDMQADNDGLHAGGTAVLAGIASTLKLMMDFRAGKPSDVIQDIAVSGTADERSLARAGLDTQGMLKGPVTMQARLRTQRGGHADIEAQADAARAAISIPRIGYAKAAGRPLHADLALAMDQDRLTAINHVRVEGAGIALVGAADVADGRPDLVRFDSLALGAATRAHGTMRLPRRKGEPYVLTVSGPVLDASGPLNPGNDTDGKAKANAGATSGESGGGGGTPYIVDARFDRVLLGHGREVLDAAAHAESDGTLIRTAQLTGLAQSEAPRQGGKAEPFQVTLAPEPGGRRLVARAPDAGGLLRALGVADDIQGGRMDMAGHYSDAEPGRPLTGTAQLTNFRVLDAPAIGRVLQAATLYGLIEVLRGPGLGFLKAVAPFRWAGSRLTLNDARAYSASLGLTAQGVVDLDAHMLDLKGTVVPFYALNTLPGRIPLIGRLFSPEKSGGVFATTYTVRGPMSDPKVGVNPLTTVAPGMLRKLFTLF